MSAQVRSRDEGHRLTSSPRAQNNSGCKPGPQPDTVVFCADDTRYFAVMDVDTQADIPTLTNTIYNESDAALHTQVLTLDQLTL